MAAQKPTLEELLETLGPSVGDAGSAPSLLVAAAELIDAWLDGNLTRGDSDALRAAVQQGGAWQDLYRSELQARTAHVLSQRSDAPWFLGQARSDLQALSVEDPVKMDQMVWSAVLASQPQARTLNVALPHLGPDSRVEVFTCDRGTRWQEAGRVQWLEPVSIVHRWGDEVTGPLQTRIVVERATPLADARHAVHALRLAADGHVTEHAKRISLSICRDLQNGRFFRMLKQVAEAFEAGRDLDTEPEDELQWVVLAVEARISLEHVAANLDEPAVTGALLDADEALRPWGAALFFLDEELYEDVISELGADEDTWWAVPARTERELPADDLLNDDTWSTVAARVGKKVNRAAAPLFAAGPSEGPAAPAAVPGVGASRVALVDFTNEQGVLSMLSIRHIGPTPGVSWFRGPDHLRASARDAVRLGFEAAVKLTPHRLPPHYLDEYQIDLELPPGWDRPVDGYSLAVPAAVAFISLWSDKPAQERVVATGGIDTRDFARVTPVGGITHKSEAAANIERALLLVPEGAEKAVSMPLEVQGIADVESAVRAAGLDPAACTHEPCIAQADAYGELQLLARAIKTQRFDKYKREGLDPWTVMADHAMLLLAVMPPDDAAAAADARAWVAVAYQHAGRSGETRALLGNLDEVRGRPPLERATAGIAWLGAFIDNGDWTGVTAATDLLRGIAPNDSDPALMAQLSIAESAIGRGYMHRADGRDLAEAARCFRRAIDLERAHAPSEVGRTLMSLAMALRMSDDLEGARSALQTARELLESPEMHAYSGSLTASTLMYWHYEAARVALAKREPALATFFAREALQRADHLGFTTWPRAGILRTMAWAQRAQGDTRSAEASIKILRHMAAGEPSAAFRTFLEGLAGEAAGPERSDGEVY